MENFYLHKAYKFLNIFCILLILIMLIKNNFEFFKIKFFHKKIRLFFDQILIILYISYN